MVNSIINIVDMIPNHGISSKLLRTKATKPVFQLSAGSKQWGSKLLRSRIWESKLSKYDDHIGWATLMHLSSIYSTNPRTNPWNFREKILRIGGVENLSFFDFFFASFQWKSVNIYRTASIGRNFDDYFGFLPQTTPA